MSHRVSSLIVMALFCVLLGSCADDATPFPRPTDSVQARVDRVIDGDTVEMKDGSRVRYIGINTPERHQPFYAQASEANRDLVEGKAVWMALDAQSTDRYGRILAYLWVGDTFVNAELVRQGYANVYTNPPNVRYSQEILAAEQEAREAEVGLWAPADVEIAIQDLHYDAEGPDHENPNGEWISLVNNGAEVVPLEGFTLKDEGNHIYTFSAVQLAPGQVIRIHSGQGRDSAEALYWGLSGDAIWSNQGDTAYLRDTEGRLVDSYGY